ncbi:L,D-transpeptidase family protein [Olsenella intestinalis]|uniref:L,D-transpeptidase family protein n=1 Tax=Olsenella intestinalis TaxID=2930083 RepID=UPI00200CB58F|nr:L,D-transpeptidase family protein [Olsenella intestinalis]
MACIQPGVRMTHRMALAATLAATLLALPATAALAQEATPPTSGLAPAEAASPNAAQAGEKSLPLAPGASAPAGADVPEAPGAPDPEGDAGVADPATIADPAATADPATPTNAATPADPAATADPATRPASEAPASATSPAADAKPEPDPATPADPEPAPEVTYSNMYRLYNPWTGEHFYTASLFEAARVAEAGWQWEAVGWVAPDAGDPVFRLYNPYAGDHHYTLSTVERDHLVSVGWRYEGIGWYSDGSADSLAVLRQYNPYATAGAHNFTTSPAEDAHLASVGWRREGEAWRASNHETLKIDGFWLVTGAWGSLDRYWVGADCQIARSRLVTPDEGAGWLAYATHTGAVVRGGRDRGDGWAWLADQDGRLATGSGWVVSDAFGQGLQRYWLESRGDYSLARVGHFQRDGAHYLGTSAGYVLRGKMSWGDGVLLADNDGRLAWQEGWLVTDVYDGYLCRYRIDTAPGDGLMGARVGFFSLGGSTYYGIPGAGYCLINATWTIDGRIWQADADGRLTEIVAPPGFEDMFHRAQGYDSPTSWLIMVDLSDHQVGVFRGSAGAWRLERGFACSCGAPETPTVEGVFQIGSRGYSFGSGLTCYYWTQFYGDYLFHSTLYYEGTFEPLDPTLGASVSHGCVRLDINDAYYINAEVPSSTTVVTYY